MIINEPQFTEPSSAGNPSFTIKVGGRETAGEVLVKSIVVSNSFNRIASAELLLYDGEPSTQDFKLSNTKLFVPGAEVEILTGYDSDEELLFKGVVVRHGLRIYRDKPSVLHVECKDSVCRLTNDRKSRYFYDLTDADAIKQIVSEADIELGDVEETKVNHSSLVQYYTTDWDFIVTRAESNGKFVFTNNGKLTVTGLHSETPILHLKYGYNILDFEAVIDARSQVDSVTATSWNSDNQEVVTTQGSLSALSVPGNITSEDLSKVVGRSVCELQHVNLQDDELREWADSKLMKSRYAKVRGRVKVRGISGVMPGKFIKLDGVGERFNGETVVSGVRHEISSNNWVTDISFGLSKDFFGVVQRDISAIPGMGLLPAISGMQIALVTSLEDPEGAGRVQIRLPIIDPAEQGVWARLATLDAGNERGVFFHPEIDDEVLVGFLGNDPRSPVILGMLNSKSKPSPVEVTSENHIKGLVTRSKIKLLFNDEEISMTMETPNGNAITLSDADAGVKITDEHGSSILMGSDGLIVDSSSDILLKANGSIKIEGADVVLKSTTFKAEGSSGVELTSGASTVIKGAVVQIN